MKETIKVGDMKLIILLIIALLLGGCGQADEYFDDGEWFVVHDGEGCYSISFPFKFIDNYVDESSCRTENEARLLALKLNKNDQKTWTRVDVPSDNN